MCGRFYLIATPEQLINTFQISRLARYEINYNMPPGHKILSVVKLDDASYKAVYLHWGLIPHWSKDDKIGQHLINARAETVLEKPAFKSAFRQRRCLIPVSGFYEWQKTEPGKQAYRIYHYHKPLLALAGLWEYWEHDGQTQYTCSIITTAANSFMKPVHQRMPVVITENNFDLWLDKQSAVDKVQLLLTADAYQGMSKKPVSNWVNNPMHNDKNCLN